MNVNFDSIWHIIGLLGTIGSLIFYAARTLGKTMEQIERLQEALVLLQQNLESQTKSCKDGRIELWTEVNKMRERLAKVETLQEHQTALSVNQK
ncbi:MAG: hypothetical protein GOVbin564_22 [Prokaryotic dsDNA virus sp.]|nr:MAG: hypothetical protein GOVbin564_22 [Prokaryotic dsDNA virus sp.]